MRRQGKKDAKQLYLLSVTGCVEIKQHGPYRSEAAFHKAAVKIHQEQDDATDSLFWLEVNFERRRVAVGGFSGSYFAGEGS